MIAAPRDLIWDALRDVGALHTRLVPGFVVDTRLERPDVRVVTFGNGMTLREPIISIDDRRYRLAWSAEGEPIVHYNASIELLDDPDGTRVVWTTDVLPHGLEPRVAAMQDEAFAAMKHTLEAAAAMRVISPRDLHA